MKAITFRNAYYIKLGKNGEWEESSIREGKIRIGWTQTNVDDINSGNWTKIKNELEKGAKHKGVATRDYHVLHHIADSTSEDVWITFYQSRLWWCKVGKVGIREDEKSKYRKVASRWHDCDIQNNKLIVNQIPGTLSKLQGFRGTICRVNEVDDLRRLLNNKQSEASQAITEATNNLVAKIEYGLQSLHWKDFEILVDLVFRGAGWRRITELGESMKYADIVLECPMTRELYQVQIKSSATIADFKSYARNFSSAGFRKFYFVVHSPDGDWSNYSSPENTEILLPGELAKRIVEFGLTNWLLKKIK